MKKVIITIGADAEPRVETQGFIGAECLKATVEIEASLGRTTKDDKTAEFHQRPAFGSVTLGR